MPYGHPELSMKKAAARREMIARSLSRTALMILTAILLLPLAGLPALAGPGQPGAEEEVILKEVRALIDKDPTNVKNLRQAAATLETASARFPQEPRFPLYLAEAYCRMADPAAAVEGEFPYYEKGGCYAQKALELAPGLTEAHYWHGLFLLKQAQKCGGRGAYFLVKDGIRELEKVRQALPAYDHAGASRVLAVLYYVAPSWTPFRDLDKSIKLGREATRLAPDYALNRLYLAEAYHQRGDKADAIREYRALLTVSAEKPGPQAEGCCRKARDMLRSLGDAV
jgi:tetratricopeptide (TPR) repeat protein